MGCPRAARKEARDPLQPVQAQRGPLGPLNCDEDCSRDPRRPPGACKKQRRVAGRAGGRRAVGGGGVQARRAPGEPRVSPRAAAITNKSGREEGSGAGRRQRSGGRCAALRPIGHSGRGPPGFPTPPSAPSAPTFEVRDDPVQLRVDRGVGHGGGGWAARRVPGRPGVPRARSLPPAQQSSPSAPGLG